MNQARWEFPSGRLEDGEDPYTCARREWEEEVGTTLPASAEFVGSWTSPDGEYVGYVFAVPRESDIRLSEPDGEEITAIGWWSKDDLSGPCMRDKVTDTLTRVTPLLKAWTAQPRGKRGKWRTQSHVRWEKFHRHTDRLVAHYTPEIERAMAERVTRTAVQAVVTNAYRNVAKAKPTGKPTVAAILAGISGVGAVVPAAGYGGAAASITALAPVFVNQLATVGTLGAAATVVAIVSALYADAYLEGAQEAAGESGGSLPPWTVPLDLPADGNWEPNSGVASAAQAVAGTGLAQLLADAHVTVKGVGETQLDRIGDAIAKGLVTGLPMATVEATIAAIIDTAARANVIAETETMRAQYAGWMDQYRRNGVPELEWLIEPGACPKCVANHEASPQPTTNPRWPFGPIPVHPSTRCAIAPAYGSLLEQRGARTVNG